MHYIAKLLNVPWPIFCVAGATWKHASASLLVAAWIKCRAMSTKIRFKAEVLSIEGFLVPLVFLWSFEPVHAPSPAVALACVTLFHRKKEDESSLITNYFLCCDQGTTSLFASFWNHLSFSQPPSSDQCHFLRLSCAPTRGRFYFVSKVPPCGTSEMDSWHQ